MTFTPPKLDTPAERFKWLIDKAFDGSQRKFAAETKCSPSVIAKIIRGEQKLGNIVRSKIAKTPWINVDWIITGKGEPLNYLHRDIHTLEALKLVSCSGRVLLAGMIKELRREQSLLPETPVIGIEKERGQK